MLQFPQLFNFGKMFLCKFSYSFFNVTSLKIGSIFNAKKEKTAKNNYASENKLKQSDK